jgi:hypothetical protein
MIREFRSTNPAMPSISQKATTPKAISIGNNPN